MFRSPLQHIPAVVLLILPFVATLLPGTGAVAQPALVTGNSALLKRDNLGANVNSPRLELMPLISPDGRTLYFDRKYDSNNVGGLYDSDDIYYSTLQRDGTWSPARNIGPPLNTDGSDVMLWIAPDGATALVHNGADVEGREMGLAITRKGKNGKWGKPVPISIMGMEDLTEYGGGYSACISSDGRRLILGRARDTVNPENLDLYSCPALGSDYLRWGTPETLGDTVNTILYEWAPYLAPDNMTLYYASGGLMGLGGSDVYMTRRLDDTWRKWSEPVNMGTGINTGVYETSIMMTPDGGKAYITAEPADSLEVSFGNTDIYMVTVPEPLRPFPVATVSGTVKAGSRGVRALVRAVDSTTGRELASTICDARGTFRLTLISGRTYRITAWAQGHDETMRVLSADEFRTGTVTMQFNLVRPKESLPGRVGAR